MSASSLRKNGEMPVSSWTSSTLSFWRNACSTSSYRSAVGMASALRSSCGEPGRSVTASSSRERMAFWNASLKVRPMAMASPTLFMCVVSSRSESGNFSNAQRGILTTT